MKQTELSHPRVFSDPVWAEGYYKRNKKNIQQVGKRFVKLLKKAGFTKGSILDVGCGFASVPIEIAKAFPQVNIIGIDLGEPLLEIGKSLIYDQRIEKQITLSTGDALNLQYDDHTFDAVINTFLLHIVENPILMLNEIERVAKPEAKILITDLRRGFLAYFIKKLKKAYALQEAADIIEKSELRKGVLSSGFFWWDYVVAKHVDTDK